MYEALFVPKLPDGPLVANPLGRYNAHSATHGVAFALLTWAVASLRRSVELRNLGADVLNAVIASCLQYKLDTHPADQGPLGFHDTYEIFGSSYSIIISPNQRVSAQFMADHMDHREVIAFHAFWPSTAMAPWQTCDDLMSSAPKMSELICAGLTLKWRFETSKVKRLTFDLLGRMALLCDDVLQHIVHTTVVGPAPKYRKMADHERQAVYDSWQAGDVRLTNYHPMRVRRLRKEVSCLLLRCRCPRSAMPPY